MTQIGIALSYVSSLIVDVGQLATHNEYCAMHCTQQTLGAANCSHPAALSQSVCGQLVLSSAPYFLNHTGIIDDCPQAAAVLWQALLNVPRNRSQLSYLEIHT